MNSQWMAAVLACGPGAALSHRSAGARLDLLPSPAAGTPIDVSVPGRAYRQHAGLTAIDRAGSWLAAVHLRTVLAASEEPPALRFELERQALTGLRTCRPAEALVNSVIATACGPLEVDFHWADRGLVVEADGYEWHSSRRALEDERRRDQLLIAAGFRVVRVTWRQVRRAPDALVDTLTA
jgi:very-short-patch-repair endonuclease